MGDGVWGPGATEQDSLEWEWSGNPGQGLWWDWVGVRGVGPSNVGGSAVPRMNESMNSGLTIGLSMPWGVRGDIRESCTTWARVAGIVFDGKGRISSIQGNLIGAFPGQTS